MMKPLKKDATYADLCAVPEDVSTCRAAGRRFETSPYDRELILTSSSVTNVTLAVGVRRRTASPAALYKAINEKVINEDPAARLDAAFGSTAVTREDFP